MRLYEIILPRRDNDGVALHQAHKHYGRWLAETFGGFTQYAVSGQWVDAGKVYTDESVAYRIAAKAGAAQRLTDRAAAMFPDQLAFYVADIGRAAIVERAGVVKLT